MTKQEQEAAKKILENLRAEHEGLMKHYLNPECLIPQEELQTDLVIVQQRIEYWERALNPAADPEWEQATDNTTMW